MKAKIIVSFTQEFINSMNDRGFSISDCPSCEIQPEWEGMPIIQAIRELEKEMGCTYPIMRRV